MALKARSGRQIAASTKSLVAVFGVLATGTATSFLGAEAPSVAAAVLTLPTTSSASPAESPPPIAEPAPSSLPSAQAVAPGDPTPLLQTGSGPKPSRDTTDRIASYKLSAELFPDTHKVIGTGTITWRNTSRVRTDRMFVHLYLNAFRDERTQFYRTPIRGYRGDPLDGPGQIDVEKFFVREWEKDIWPSHPHTPADPDDATDIELVLPQFVEPGATLTIDMAWKSQLPTITLRTGYFGAFHMVAQWFPKVARLEEDGTWVHFPFHRMSEFYADYGTYDVTITRPSAFVLGAVGVEQPVVLPIASERTDAQSPRSAQRFVADNVHDFAFTAWDGFRTLTDVTEGGVKLTCLYPDGYEAAAQTQLSAAKAGLGYFSAAFGDYPYPTLTLVHPPAGADEAGGMEYPTLITTGGFWRRGPANERSLEILTLHELAHQWFYGLVGSNENKSPFLDEGLTSYAETDACEAFWPSASVAEAFGYKLGLPALHRAGALEATGNARVTDGASSFVSGTDYAALVYSRSATTLRTLGNVYGEDKVRRAVGTYARRYRFAHPTAEDFFSAMEESLGSEAASALRTALAELSSVDYSVETIEPVALDDGHGFRSQILLRRRGNIRLPVDVLLVTEDGEKRTVRWDGASETFWLRDPGPSKIAAVVIDPEHRVLLDEDLTNNALRSGGSRFAWRTFSNLAFVGGVFARAFLP